MELISVATLNASCIFKLKYAQYCNSKCWRANFLKELCNELIIDNVKIRKCCTKITQDLRAQLNSFASRSLETYAKLCNCCSKPSITMKECSICSETACTEHFSLKEIMFCRKCQVKSLPVIDMKKAYKRSRCRMCKDDRKTYIKCATCQLFICSLCQHTITRIVCNKCFNL